MFSFQFTLRNSVEAFTSCNHKQKTEWKKWYRAASLCMLQLTALQVQEAASADRVNPGFNQPTAVSPCSPGGSPIQPLSATVLVVQIQTVSFTHYSGCAAMDGTLRSESSCLGRGLVRAAVSQTSGSGCCLGDSGSCSQPDRLTRVSAQQHMGGRARAERPPYVPDPDAAVCPTEHCARARCACRGSSIGATW